MKILDVLRGAVIALYSDEGISKLIVLKGGSALHFAEDVTSRLSTDIDLSTPDAINDPRAFFSHVEQALDRYYKKFSLDVVDVKYQRKPKKQKRGFPSTWGGWEFTFKLSPASKGHESADKRRRSAIVPEGGTSSTIEIEVSEHEFCGDVKTVTLGESQIRVYSPALIILEKVRALCQQHPDYPFHGSRNRAQDYYDIDMLVRKHRKAPNFMEHLRDFIGPVFAAKQVSLELAEKIFDADFSNAQKMGFVQVAEYVEGTVEAFEVYQERLKLLIAEILKNPASTQ